ncbi:MAG: CYTH domain-containing protein [Candidatus Yonathbacteria bacterium]|nr:CYTH domain-containing protein [Candidatus Yonathbacteria bacterium]
MSLYEIEIKSLLGKEEQANDLRRKIEEHPLSFSLASKNKQINHYFNFTGELGERVPEDITQHFSDTHRKAFDQIVQKGKSFSVRTRHIDGRTIFVIKASLDDQTSSNGISRAEFEAEIPLLLSEIDQVLLDAGFDYLSKWSREREEYVSGDVHICIDRNAGYGYLAEFEKVIPHESEVENTKQSLYDLMKEFGVEELPQDRLDRMFAHYNKCWPEYYGTEKIFCIE